MTRNVILAPRASRLAGISARLDGFEPFEIEFPLP